MAEAAAARTSGRPAGGWLALPAGALSGVLIVAAGPPYGRAALVLVALAPLLAFARVAGAPAALGAGAVAGVLVSIGAAPWLPAALARTLGIAEGTALGLAAALALYHAAPFALAALAAHWAWRGTGDTYGGSLGAAALCAAAWTCLEWVFPQALPWTLGSLLGPLPALRSAAAAAGTYGLTFLVVLVNALLAAAGLAARRAPWRAVVLLVAVGMACLAAAWGGAIATAGARPGGATLRVAAVQGGPSPPPSDLALANAQAWATYGALTRDLGARADVVVWPEMSLPMLVRDNRELRRALAALLAALGRPLLFGALDRDEHGAGEWNTAYLATARAPVSGAGPPGPEVDLARYHKLRLVPFGEYVPLLDGRLPRLRRGARLVPGTGRRPLHIPGTAGGAGAPASVVAPSICFEAILPGWLNPLVRDGADWLVNLTDDAWFGGPHAAAQHLEMTRLRAVETGRWLVRASGSGVSAIVDPRGTIVAALPYGTRGVLVEPIVLHDHLTPYVRLGDWIVAVSAAALAAAALHRLRRG